MSADFRREIVAEARRWIGTPYRHQASAKGAGCDCLGLVRGVWRARIGSEPEAPPPYARDWAERGGGELLLEAARRWLIRADRIEPGCVLVFRFGAGLPAKHCGISSAPDRMVHALEGRAVCEVGLTPGWRTKIAGVFAFPDPDWS